jgi:hypothetical protein
MWMLRARAYKCEESCGELRFATEKVDHGLLLYAHDGAAQKRARGRGTKRPTGQATFSQEAAFRKNGKNGPLLLPISEHLTKNPIVSKKEQIGAVGDAMLTRVCHESQPA